MARMLKRSLEGVLSEAESRELFSAFDQVGGIIVLRIPDALLPKRKMIGERLLGEVKTARSVFYQSSPVGGDYRTRSLEILAGEDNTETEYRESGCRFVVDVENAFFSPRLATERGRIAGLVRDGETVMNMFGGVGMFSVVAAKNRRCTVYNIDINPAASRLCEMNIALNRMRGRIISINGGAAEVIVGGGLEEADRTLMLLPERSDEFLGSAVAATRDGGTIHYYSHIHADKKQDAGRLSEEHYSSVVRVRSEILGSRIVRAVGPRYYQTVVDARISK